MAKYYAILLSVFLFVLASFVKYSCAEELVKFRRLFCSEHTLEKNVIIRGIHQYDPEWGADCTYVIYVNNRKVQQLLIQFEFDLKQPNKLVEGDNFELECRHDYLEIEGTRYCGYEDNQHLYLPFSFSHGVNSIKIHLKLCSRRPKCKIEDYPKFFMTIEQLETGDYRLAPDGCTHYYTQESGRFKSYNYNGGHGLYPGELNYTICIRRPPTAHGLKLHFLDFNLNGQSSEVEKQLEPRQYCKDGERADYLSIPSSIVEPVTENDYLNVKNNTFCGRTIHNKTVISVSEGEFYQMRFASRKLFDKSNENGFLFKYDVLHAPYLQN